jgi:hypothetical protein
MLISTHLTKAMQLMMVQREKTMEDEAAERRLD